MRRIKLLHVITSLGQGGAESMLYKILLNMDRNIFELYVLSMTDEGDFAEKIRAQNIPIISLNMKKNFLSFCSSFIKYYRLIKKIQPDLIQGWMYHANLLALLARCFLKKSKIIFNIRSGFVKTCEFKLTTRLVIQLNAWFSKCVNKVINNSKISQKQHESIGVSIKNSIYIPNGFDVSIFTINSRIYQSLRLSLKLDPHVKIIGNIARFHPVKNHEGLLKIFKIIKEQFSENIKFILAGKGIDSENRSIVEKIQEFDLVDDCILLGPVKTEAIMPAFDVYVSTSWSEGFPNVIGEAMACGVPCVATNVGDCKLVIDEFGDTAAVGDYNTLAAQIVKWLDTSEQTKMKIRQHIIDHYSIQNIVNQYENLYLNILN